MEFTNFTWEPIEKSYAKLSLNNTDYFLGVFYDSNNYTIFLRHKDNEHHETNYIEKFTSLGFEVKSEDLYRLLYTKVNKLETPDEVINVINELDKKVIVDELIKNVVGIE